MAYRGSWSFGGGQKDFPAGGFKVGLFADDPTTPGSPMNTSSAAPTPGGAATIPRTNSGPMGGAGSLPGSFMGLGLGEQGPGGTPGAEPGAGPGGPGFSVGEAADVAGRGGVFGLSTPFGNVGPGTVNTIGNIASHLGAAIAGPLAAALGPGAMVMGLANTVSNQAAQNMVDPATGLPVTQLATNPAIVQASETFDPNAQAQGNPFTTMGSLINAFENNPYTGTVGQTFGGQLSPGGGFGSGQTTTDFGARGIDVDAGKGVDPAVGQPTGQTTAPAEAATPAPTAPDATAPTEGNEGVGIAGVGSAGGGSGSSDGGVGVGSAAGGGSGPAGGMRRGGLVRGYASGGYVSSNPNAGGGAAGYAKGGAVNVRRNGMNVGDPMAFAGRGYALGGPVGPADLPVSGAGATRVGGYSPELGIGQARQTPGVLAALMAAGNAGSPVMQSLGGAEGINTTDYVSNIQAGLSPDIAAALATQNIGGGGDSGGAGVGTGGGTGGTGTGAAGTGTGGDAGTGASGGGTASGGDSGAGAAGVGTGDGGVGSAAGGGSGAAGGMKKGGAVKGRPSRPDPKMLVAQLEDAQNAALSTKLKKGGVVNKGARKPGADDVPVRLSRGEYVEPKAAADTYGPVLDEIRRRALAKSGGMGVGASKSRAAVDPLQRGMDRRPL